MLGITKHYIFHFFPVLNFMQMDHPMYIFHVCIYVCMWKSLTCVQLIATPRTVACQLQAPLSMEFSRQKHWSGLPFSYPGDLPDPGIEAGSPALQADSLPSKPINQSIYSVTCFCFQHCYDILLCWCVASVCIPLYTSIHLFCAWLIGNPNKIQIFLSLKQCCYEYSCTVVSWYIFKNKSLDTDLKVKVKVAQSYPTLRDPMDHTVHGIFLAKILEWVAVLFSRNSSQPRDWTQISHITGGFFASWARPRSRISMSQGVMKLFFTVYPVCCCSCYSPVGGAITVRGPCTPPSTTRDSPCI